MRNLKVDEGAWLCEKMTCYKKVGIWEQIFSKQYLVDYIAFHLPWIECLAPERMDVPFILWVLQINSWFKNFRPCLLLNVFCAGSKMPLCRAIYSHIVRSGLMGAGQGFAACLEALQPLEQHKVLREVMQSCINRDYCSFSLGWNVMCWILL